MNIKKFFHRISLGFYEPKFTHNPEDFKIRVIPSWFSDDYATFEYSANGGISWRLVKHAEQPINIFRDNWGWGVLTYKIHKNSTFEYELEKLSSYEKILEYEAREKQILKEGLEDVDRQRAEHYQSIRDSYNRINKNLSK